MRVWDISPDKLCDNHLLGEHREIHAIWSIITKNKKGYCNHPEVKRWRGKLKALYKRHQKIVKEMKERGFKHRSPLNHNLASGKAVQDKYVTPPKKQKTILKNKGCNCQV